MIVTMSAGKPAQKRRRTRDQATGFGPRCWFKRSGCARLGIASALFFAAALPIAGAAPSHQARIRYLIETDAGGDPDDEQSFVRFLLYANEWDIEGIIANRAQARDGENLNPETQRPGHPPPNDPGVRKMLPYPRATRPSLSERGAVRALRPRLRRHEASVDLIIAVVDRADPRPVWFSNWGTDHGSAPSCLERALDRVRRQRGQAGYAQFKEKLRLSSATLSAKTLALWPRPGNCGWIRIGRNWTANAGITGSPR